MQFRCGSGLARLGTAAVQIRFRICTDLVQIQFMTGSESLQILFCWAQRQSRFGSELDQVWLGWAQWRFRIGSQLDLGSCLVHIYGSDSVQIGFRFGPGSARLGSMSVQLRLRFGTGGARLAHRPDSGQMWLRCGSHALDCGTDSVQNLFRFDSQLVQIWFTFGSALVQF